MLSKKYKVPIASFPVSSKTIVKNDYFIVKSISTSLGYSRIGVTFRSKAFKTAVLRNKLKRIIFDFFRLQAKSYKLKANGVDLLIILNPPIISLSKDQIEAELKKI